METMLLLERLGAGLNGGDHAREIDRTLNAIQKIAVMTTAIAALETLVARSHLDDTGPYSARIREPSEFRNRPRRLLAPMLPYPRVLVFPAAQLLAATRLLIGKPGPMERAALVTTVLGASAAMNVHHHYGSDGADQVSFMTLLTTLLAQAFPNDERAKRACLRMIAFQSCLSYSASGAVKLASRTWRSGQAISGVFRTATFGDEQFYRLTKLHPAIPKIMAWTVILTETLFPLVLATPKPISRGILGVMATFHLANARFMGLNRFVFAFASTYPALAFVQKEQ